MTVALLEKPTLENNSIDGWPSTVDMKVIDPGVVFYEDLVNSEGKHVGGNILVQKAALDRIMPTYAGKPIINWDHRNVNPKEYGQGKFQGIVTDVYYNADDGWWHARGYVWDEATRRNIQNGYSISCAYNVTEWGNEGSYHKVPYIQEALNGVGTHIAVVEKPRYEGARIELLNSVKGGVMGILSIFKKDKQEEKIDIDTSKAVVSIEGHGDKTVAELVNSYASNNPPKLDGMDTVIINEKKVTIDELKNSFLKNADMEKAHKDGDHKESANKNCGMCNSAAFHEPTNLHEKASTLPKTYNNADEQKLKKEDEERRNAEEEKKKEEEEKKNALSNSAKFDEMRNKNIKIEMPKINNLTDLMKEGVNRYGSAKTAATK